MAAPINPAHSTGLPHSKFTIKQAQDIRARIEFKRARLEKLREEKDKIEQEINELIKKDTQQQLCLEFGVSPTTIQRIANYSTYFRRAK